MIVFFVRVFFLNFYVVERFFGEELFGLFLLCLCLVFYQVMTELGLHFVLSVPETFSDELLDLIVVQFRDTLGLFGVLQKLGHGPHSEGGDKVAVKTVAVEDPENF